MAKFVLPSSSDKVPYIGALQPVDLGSQTLTTTGFGSFDGVKIFAPESSTNTVVGNGAGTSIAAGALNNTIIGRSAGASLTTSNNNVLIGAFAGKNVDGLDNLMLGSLAGEFANGAGATRNVYMGTWAGLGTDDASNTAGDNVGLGWRSLRRVEDGDKNLALGSNTCQALTTGSRNSVIGYSAGLLLTTGGNNILIGHDAAEDLTTGNQNIIIGNDVDTSAVDASFELNIGNLLKGTRTGHGSGETLGIPFDNAPFYFGVDGILNSYIQWTGSALEIVVVEDDMDLVFKVNDGAVERSITWNADVDQLEHSAGVFNWDDDFLMIAAEKIQFRDTAIGIYSQADTFLDLFADGGVRIGDSSGGAPTTYIEFEANGDMFWVGAGSGLPFGNMYIATEVVVDITTNNPTEVFDATDDGWTIGDLNLVTFPTGGDEHFLTVEKGGEYHIAWSMSMSTVTGGANVEVEGGVMVNGASAASGRAHRTIATTTDTGAMCSSTFLRLSANDEISLFVLNESNFTNIAVAHATLTIHMVGG